MEHEIPLGERYGYNIPDTFTRRLLLYTLREHHASVGDFDRDHPLADEYNADDVLSWLGY